MKHAHKTNKTGYAIHQQHTTTNQHKRTSFQHPTKTNTSTKRTQNKPKHAKPNTNKTHIPKRTKQTLHVQNSKYKPNIT